MVSYWMTIVICCIKSFPTCSGLNENPLHISQVLDSELFLKENNVSNLPFKNGDIVETNDGLRGKVVEISEYGDVRIEIGDNTIWKHPSQLKKVSKELFPDEKVGDKMITVYEVSKDVLSDKEVNLKISLHTLDFLLKVLDQVDVEKFLNSNMIRQRLYGEKGLQNQLLDVVIKEWGNFRGVFPIVLKENRPEHFCEHFCVCIKYKTFDGSKEVPKVADFIFSDYDKAMGFAHAFQNASEALYIRVTNDDGVEKYQWDISQKKHS